MQKGVTAVRIPPESVHMTRRPRGNLSLANENHHRDILSGKNAVDRQSNEIQTGQ